MGVDRDLAGRSSAGGDWVGRQTKLDNSACWSVKREGWVEAFEDGFIRDDGNTRLTSEVAAGNFRPACEFGTLRDRLILVLGLLFACASGSAERSIAAPVLTPLPAGVTLPVRISRSLRAGEVKAGTKLVVKTTQRVPIGEQVYLKPGAELEGEVVASTAADGTKAALLEFRFTHMRYRKQTVPVTVKAIAIANFTEVGDTFLPATGGPDRGNASPASWTTQQVGGDEVYRSGWVGPVCDSVMRMVGYADYWGVYSLPARPPGGDGSALPRAMGVFSTTAKGLYGFEEGVSLHSSGGTITLSGVGKKLVVRNGDNLLLEVVSSGKR